MKLMMTIRNSKFMKLFMKKGTLNCRDFFEILSDYHEGNLNEEEKASFESHFSRCKHCKDFLSGFKTTMALVSNGIKKNYNDITVPPEVENCIISYMTDVNNRKSKL